MKLSVNQLITHGIYLLAYMALQLLVFYDTAIYGLAFCMVYVGFLLTLPLNMHHLVLMVVGLVYGLLVDSFYDTPGIHATACVAVCYLRPFHLRLITPRGGYEGYSEITINDFGIQWFVSYLLPLVFAHHWIVFILQLWGSKQFTGLLCAILSTLFTSVMLIVLQYLFRQVRRN
jgi:hypothetical protein